MRVHWSGFTGSPGLSTLYFSVGTDPVTAVRNLFVGLAPLFPNTVTWSFDNSGDQLDELSGNINGSWSGTAGANVTGSAASASNAGAAGTAIRWRTAVIANGHRVKGTTFLVPTAASVWDTDGTMTAAALSTATAALGTYLATATGLAQKIFSRPRPPLSGASSAVTGASILDKCIVLRSRRS
jgi:hypothetical protein